MRVKASSANFHQQEVVHWTCTTKTHANVPGARLPQACSKLAVAIFRKKRGKKGRKKRQRAALAFHSPLFHSAEIIAAWQPLRLMQSVKATSVDSAASLAPPQ